MNEAETHNLAPEWLEERRNQSWQIQIVIVGAAIIFLTRIPEFFLDIFRAGIEGQGRSLSAEYILLVFGGLVFSRALLIGFSLNLVLRAIWLGYLSIAVTYPNGINFLKLNYSEYFQNKLKLEKSTLEKVLYLERLCSLTYAIGIIMTLVAIGTFGLLILISSLLREFIPSLYDPNFFNLFLLFTFLFLVGIFDYLFFSLLKKRTLASRLYYPIHTFMSYISLSFLYRREWLTLISRTWRWGLFLIFIFYFFVASLIAQYDLNTKTAASLFVNFNTFSESRNYADLYHTYQRISTRDYESMLTDKERITSACIQSPIIKDNYLKLFVLYRKSFDPVLDSLFSKHNFITQKPDVFQLRGNELRKNDQKFVQAFQEFITVYLDNEKISPLTWHFHHHPITKQEGYLSFVPLDSLRSGEHKLILDKRYFDEDSLKWSIYREIDFVKE